MSMQPEKTNLPNAIAQMSSWKIAFLWFEGSCDDNITNPANEFGNFTFGKHWGWTALVVKWVLRRRRSTVTKWGQFCQTVPLLLHLIIQTEAWQTKINTGKSFARAKWRLHTSSLSKRSMSPPYNDPPRESEPSRTAESSQLAHLHTNRVSENLNMPF